MNILVLAPNIDISGLNLLNALGARIIQPRQNFEPGEIDAFFIDVTRKISANFLHRYTNVKYILTASVGTDHIDLKACSKMGIKVFSAPASNSDAVAEHTVFLMVASIRHSHVLSLKDGSWRIPNNFREGLSQKIVGIIGCGQIGQKVGNLVHSFSVKKVLGYDTVVDKATLKQNGIEKVGLKTLLERSEIISLHLPLNPQTKNFINLQKLLMMRPEAHLINTSRGEIINEYELVMALNAGVIAGAALDVFSNKPFPNRELVDHPRVYATPHIAAYTKDTREKMATKPVDALLKHLVASGKDRASSTLFYMM